MKPRTSLQNWSSCRNYFKKKLYYARGFVNDFISISDIKAHKRQDGVLVPLLSEDELDKLKQAQKLLNEVNDSYRETYFKLKQKII